ncbi:hypothetical protein Acr_09g0004880 [Actinidia rufa]|uniref:Uncharacterized protein n=1 Tax=Actinidia rufa TaxID=165716 RepID=A0A7J0F5Q5_9ERIC|nr:hypothetical protein Acr_09g0004880 [Actinidia rufa]
MIAHEQFSGTIYSRERANDKGKGVVNDKGKGVALDKGKGFAVADRRGRATQVQPLVEELSFPHYVFGVLKPPQTQLQEHIPLKGHQVPLQVGSQKLESQTPMLEEQLVKGVTIL